jgi:acetyltransferase-like isoleucine patch superfamily enzyme
MLQKGKYTYIIGNPIHYFKKPEQQVIIGNFCSIGQGLKLYYGNGEHNVQNISTFPFIDRFIVKYETIIPSKSNINIGNDVWIGDHVTIMGGVTIGDGAVISCNSHVVKDVEPYSIVGGNPARLIRYRFTPEQIEQLLKIKWWYWDDDKIANNLYLICSQSIDTFINTHKP